MPGKGKMAVYVPKSKKMGGASGGTCTTFKDSGKTKRKMQWLRAKTR